MKKTDDKTSSRTYVKAGVGATSGVFLLPLATLTVIAFIIGILCSSPSLKAQVAKHQQGSSDMDERIHRKVIRLHVDGSVSRVGDGSIDRPYSSIEEARAYIRDLNRNDAYPSGGVLVEIAGGTYLRNETLQFTSEDSGLWNAPVIYRAVPGSTVSLIGGHRFKPSQFSPVSDSAILERLPEAARAHVRQLDLKDFDIVDYGEMPLFGHSMHYLMQAGTPWRTGGAAPELFVDGQAMTVARWPNKGFVRVGKIVEKGDHIRQWLDDQINAKNYVPVEQRNDPPLGFAFHFDDLKRLAAWQQESDLRMLGYWHTNFSEQALQVAKIDTQKGIIHSVQPSAYSIKKNQRFFVYNALSELDEQGEWYLDRESGVLYFYPPKFSKDSTVDLSLMEQNIISVKDASFIHFDGLELCVTRAQAAGVVGGEGITFINCRIGNVASHGLTLNGRGHRVVNCEVFSTGAQGIALSGGDPKLLAPAGNEVINSHIHNFGRIQKSYKPAISLGGVGNRAANNEINAGPHAAILFSGNNHLIELNHIHDVCRETDDMAAIYAGRSWFNGQGTVIRHNLIRNIGGYAGGTHVASGVYLDDGLSGVKVIGNVFIDLPQGILFNGGRENHAQRNIFINVKNMMRGTDMTEAFKTWASGGLITLKSRLKKSPYQSDIWRAHFPRLSVVLEDQPSRPKYSVIKDNLRYNSPMIIGLKGIHEEFIEVGRVKNNLETDRLPGRFNPSSGRFEFNPGFDELIPELQTIPFHAIGRF